MSRSPISGSTGTIAMVILLVLSSLAAPLALTPGAHAGSSWKSATEADFNGTGRTLDRCVIDRFGPDASIRLGIDSSGAWMEKSPTPSPPARGGHAMAAAGSDDKIVLFGGFYKDHYAQVLLDDTWVYDLGDNAWTRMFPADGPCARADHAMATVWNDDKVVLFGGRNETGQMNDSWVYDISDDQWSRRPSEVHPQARYGHTMTSFWGDTRALLFGGRGNSSGVFCDTWIYDLRGDIWTQMNTTNRPQAVYHHSAAAVWNDDRVVIFGGAGQSQLVADTWAYDAGEGQWSLRANPNGPVARCGQSMATIPLDDRVVIYGGTIPAPPYTDIGETWRFDAGDNKWSSMNTTESPAPREYLAMVGVNGSSKVVLFGGVCDRGNHTWSDTWVYDTNVFYVNGTYFSPPYDTQGVSEIISICWSAIAPPRTSVGFQLRAANTSSELQRENFTGPYLSPDNYFMEGAPMVGLPSGRRWVQYKMFLQTENRYLTPVVDDVTLYHDRLPEAPNLSEPADDRWIDQNDTTFKWIFNDTDSSSQGGFEWQLSASMNFSRPDGFSGVTVSNSSSYKHIEPLKDGIWYWRVRTQDVEGAWGPFSGCRPLKIDTDPPRPFKPNSTATGWTFHPPAINFSTTDNASGMDRYELWIDGQIVGSRTSPCQLPDMPNGAHDIVIRAYDLAGNHADGKVRVFMDKGAPEPFAPTASPPFWTFANPQITFGAVDNVSEIEHYEVRVDMGYFQRQSSPFALPALDDGVHAVTVRAFDMAGNFRDGNVLVYLDKNAPETLAVSVEPAGWTNVDPLVSFGALDRMSQVDHFEVSMDYGKFSVRSNPFIAQGLSDGYHAITVRAFDKAGNSADKSTRAFVDKTPPQAFRPMAVPGAWSRHCPNISFSTTDDYSPVLRYEIAVDDGPFIAVFSPWTDEAVPDGQHIVTVRAYDAAGNGQNGNVTIFIDRVPPTNVSLVMNFGNGTTQWRNVSLSISAFDNISGLDQMCFSKDGQGYTAWAPFVPVRNWTLSPGDGKKTVLAKLRDRAGNEAQAVSSPILYRCLQQKDQVSPFSAIAPILIAVALILGLTSYLLKSRTMRKRRKAV